MNRITKVAVTLIIAASLSTMVYAVVLNAHAQGPASGAPPQFTALADRWTKWILSIDTATEPNPFTTKYKGDCSQLIQGKTMFLVGAAGAGMVDHGTCNVPSGTSIFYPV